jgi:hypothetical protein
MGWSNEARRLRSGKFRVGAARRCLASDGPARRDGRDKVGSGRAWRGLERQGKTVGAGHDQARSREFGQGKTRHDGRD